MLDLLKVYTILDISITVAFFTVIFKFKILKTDIPKHDEIVFLCSNCLAGLACITANFIPLACSLSA